MDRVWEKRKNGRQKRKRRFSSLTLCGKTCCSHATLKDFCLVLCTMSVPINKGVA